MSGHSRWSQIKRKKGKADVERGKLFSKILREITVAARSGGGDAKVNMRLKAAVESAKAANMRVILSVLIVWAVVSVPLAVLVGRMCRARPVLGPLESRSEEWRS